MDEKTIREHARKLGLRVSKTPPLSPERAKAMSAARKTFNRPSPEKAREMQRKAAAARKANKEGRE